MNTSEREIRVGDLVTVPYRRKTYFGVVKYIEGKTVQVNIDCRIGHEEIVTAALNAVELREWTEEE